MKEKKILAFIAPSNRSTYVLFKDLITKIIKMDYSVYVIAPKSHDAGELEKIGAKTIAFESNNKSSKLFASAKYIYRLYRLLRKLKPSAVFSYTTQPAAYGSIAAKLCGVKNTSVLITNSNYLPHFQKIGLRVANKVMFRCLMDLDAFDHFYLVEREKTVALDRYGAYMENYIPTPHPDQLTFAMVSPMLNDKGVIEYAEAAKRIKQEYNNIRFLFLETADPNPTNSIDKELFADRYIDTGIVDYYSEVEDMQQFYSQCSVYVLPSYREDAPLTTIEAMAMGRAIITTDAPSCRETINYGRNGILIQPKNIDALVNAMKQFIEDNSLVKSMGDDSISFCKDRFCDFTVNDKILDAINLVTE